ncbi:MAG: ATP-dependent acyl-CoA ligase [Novosphingobium sp. SCN 63-17]|nr:MAG: ATP-dependent acyl-CoA ligase [Novosphingobium sp. SCN 63-17]OJX93598.1 MAG: ATP-dependent acyl-CoA ligase [Novosphingobium sp. 63-713]
MSMPEFSAQFSPRASRLIDAFAPDERTIVSMLQRRCETAGDTPLLLIDGAVFCARDLADRAGRSAARLAQAGIEAGDRVALLCGNRLEFFDMLLGTIWLGAIAVPINRAARGAQLQHILANSGARLLVAEADVAQAMAYVPRSDLALDAIWVLPTRGEDALPETAGEWALRPVPQPGAPREPAPTGPADTAMIIYTSGTTGPSKGVCCPQAQFFWWGLNSIDVLEIEAADVLLTTLPLFHVNALGTFFQALLSGSQLVVMDRFSASGFSAALTRHGATVTYLLGAMVSILLATPDQPDDAAHPVRRALAPGVPAQFHAAFAQRYGMTLIDGYGATESNFVIGGGDPLPGCMGKVRPGYEAIVADEDDNPLPDGTPGELLLRAKHPHAFAAGYHEMPAQTAASWRNLWLHTGDRVWRDAEGRFYFMDRIKDAIRRRGENISAFEVEQVLLSHPDITIAAVYPVPSEHGEDEVMASLILRDGAALLPEAVLDFCQPRMTYFSVPRYLRFADALPTTENGKVQKFRLREMGITPDTWDREAAGYKVARAVRAAAG